jgi:hypothetical protein
VLEGTRGYLGRRREEHSGIAMGRRRPSRMKRLWRSCVNTRSWYVQPSAGSLDATVDVSLSEMGCIVQRSRGLIGIEKRGQEVWVAGNVALLVRQC